MSVCQPVIIVGKDPDARKDYGWDWSKWLSTGDTIIESEWIVDTGLTHNGETFDGTSTTVWLSGGTLGVSYTVTNRVTTDEGRVEDNSFKVVIRST